MRKCPQPHCFLFCFFSILFLNAAGLFVTSICITIPVLANLRETCLCQSLHSMVSQPAIKIQLKGCSKTRLLLAEGWWYCKAPVSVLRKSGLVSEDAAQLFAEGSWTDRGQAEIVPVLKSVVVANSGTNL